MLKITRFTDYALVVLCCLVKNQANNGVNKLSAPEIAKIVNLQLPTVSKLLKILVKSGLVKSYRGVDGGYELAKNPDEVTVNEVITTMEGPVELTVCSNSASAQINEKSCENIVNCPVSAPWQKINAAIVNNILAKISLTDITYNKINL